MLLTGWLSKSFVPIIRQVVVTANPAEGSDGKRTKYATSDELERALYNVRREILVSALGWRSCEQYSLGACVLYRTLICLSTSLDMHYDYFRFLCWWPFTFWLSCYLAVGELPSIRFWFHQCICELSLFENHCVQGNAEVLNVRCASNHCFVPNESSIRRHHTYGMSMLLVLR